MNSKSKRIIVLAMFASIAFMVMVVGRVPVVLFLKYDPKDVIITICGFIFGPLSAFFVSVVVSFMEMLTVSENGFIGLIMNVISTSSFACVASYIYTKDRSKKHAIIGLICGCITMIITMLLWNYLIAPIYMGYPRQAVVKLLLPAFLPFNLIKGGLNAAFTMLLYKPLLGALKKSNVLQDVSHDESSEKNNKGIVIVSIIIIATGILLLLALNGKL
ncbi:ECF transporter S component [Clostridium botulinum]|uniref:ECF transporter S component n=1 Tax=Clostridium botulinum TaxID=1491 RepID=UPI003592DF40